MPVDLPQGVSATIGADAVTVKGAKGSLTLSLRAASRSCSRTNTSRWKPIRRARA